MSAKRLKGDEMENDGLTPEETIDAALKDLHSAWNHLHNARSTFGTRDATNDNFLARYCSVAITDTEKIIAYLEYWTKLSRPND